MVTPNVLSPDEAAQRAVPPWAFSRCNSLSGRFQGILQLILCSSGVAALVRRCLRGVSSLPVTSVADTAVQACRALVEGSWAWPHPERALSPFLPLSFFS